ncbi:MAG TPA: hypothetical protein VHX17_13195 [Candidatus Cybelea sp.]|jgi:hypothetical protein|nr:hypothetical protein [Candidatus Cybelea sp.]
MRYIVLFAFLASTAVSAGAQTPSGMAAMQYYAGTWACAAVGEPDSKTTATYTIVNGVMRDSVYLPPQGKMTTPYQLEIVTTFDPKNDRYVQTTLDNQSVWAVSFAKPFTGNTEEWINTATYDGKLGRVEVVRAAASAFDILGYASVSQDKPDFKVTCSKDGGNGP